ncbi:MAG: hypothetical protein IPO91_34245 [Chloroflexi bacterium]|nr:hypothetical protein [Chloroflexota bacterium]
MRRAISTGVLGAVHSKNVMDHLLLGKPRRRRFMQPALTVPASAPVTRTLELFRENSVISRW